MSSVKKKRTTRNFVNVLLSMGAIYSLIEMRPQKCRPVFFLSPMLELRFIKICTACGAISRNSIICFCVEGPSYYNQSCLNPRLLLFAPLKLFDNFVLQFFHLNLPILALNLCCIKENIGYLSVVQTNGCCKYIGSLAVDGHGLSTVW